MHTLKFSNGAYTPTSNCLSFRLAPYMHCVPPTTFSQPLPTTNLLSGVGNRFYAVHRPKTDSDTRFIHPDSSPVRRSFPANSHNASLKLLGIHSNSYKTHSVSAGRGPDMAIAGVPQFISNSLVVGYMMHT